MSTKLHAPASYWKWLDTINIIRHHEHGPACPRLQRPDAGSPAAHTGLLKWFHRKLGSLRSTDGWTVGFQVSKDQSWGAGGVLVCGFLFVGESWLRLGSRTKPAFFRRIRYRFLLSWGIRLETKYRLQSTYTEWGETEPKEDTEWTYFCNVLLVNTRIY